MSTSFQLDTPDYFTAGAVGPAGERVFYLQGAQAGQLVTLRCEKEQVRILAEYLAGFLVRRSAGGVAAAPLRTLGEPVEPAWSVASLGVGYDQSGDRIVVEATEFVEDEQQEPAVARFHITMAQAAAFVERARALMKAGRPACPMCGNAAEPGGHVCARSNGHPVR
jgi:uncharacterized repeat protein (TIGR03847 family)